MAAEAPKIYPDQSFVDTRYMSRQAGQDVPPLMLLGDLPVAEPFLPAKTPWPTEFAAARKSVAADKAVVATGGYQGNGAVGTEALLATQEIDASSLWGGARHDHILPYQDGGGQRVNYGYDRLNTQLAGNLRLSPDSRLSAFAMRDGFSNLRLPGYGLDSPRMDRYLASSVLEHAPKESGLDRLEAGVVFDALSYDADNVTLRDRGSMGLSYSGLWTTTRGLVRGGFTTGAWRNSVTLDAGLLNYNVDVDALYPAQGVASYRLPDVHTLQGGLTLATTTALGKGEALSAGLRLDGIHSEAVKRNSLPPVTGTGAAAFAVTPQHLWNTYYGAGTDSSPTNLNISARLQLSHDLEDGSGQVYADLRRAVRSPDPGERFYATSGPAALIQVGNPQLSPEAHHRFELGGRKDFDGFKDSFAAANPAGSGRVVATVYADRVVDFISADRARGQPGILMSDKAIIYRNVDATLTGIGLDGWWSLAPGWEARGRLGWTRGQNLTDHRPLYQVPPLDGEAVIEHRREVAPDTVVSLGARLSFAATQNRVDASTATGSGEDTTGATAGWALLDFFLGATLGDRLTVTGGVANVLDKRYHLHVDPLPQSPVTRFQEAPGRSLFVMTTVSF